MLKVAHNVLELLEYICSSPQKEFSVTELSREFNTSKTAVYRMLRVLTDRGYLTRNERTGHYMLGLKLLELGAQVTDKIGLLEVVSPYMEQLARETGETINLAVLHNDKIVYIHKVESSHFLRTDLRVGTAVPAYSSALGKAMLAWLEEEEWEEIINPDKLVKYTSHTITSKESFEQEFQKIRKNGYAIDYEEYIEGIICIAAPILNQQKRPVAAISVAGPKVRLTEDKLSEIGKILCNYAGEVSVRCGYK